MNLMIGVVLLGVMASVSEMIFNIVNDKKID